MRPGRRYHVNPMVCAGCQGCPATDDDIVTAYFTGREAGIERERRRWQAQMGAIVDAFDTGELTPATDPESGTVLSDDEADTFVDIGIAERLRDFYAGEYGDREE